jgi:hypothetical protein
MTVPPRVGVHVPSPWVTRSIQCKRRSAQEQTCARSARYWRPCYVDCALSLLALSLWLSPWTWSSSDWAGLTFAVIVVGLVVAWRQVKESQRLREEQARPFVIIDFHPSRTTIELTISNVGATLARDVKFEFDPPLTTTHDSTPLRGNLMELNLFKNGIPSLAPAKEVKLFFDQFPSRIEQELPMTYDVQVSYRDPAGKKYSEPTVLDLAMYLGTGGVKRNDLHDIHRQLEAIAKEIQKWTAFGGGIKTMSPADLKQREHELDELYAEQQGESPRPPPLSHGTSTTQLPRLRTARDPFLSIAAGVLHHPSPPRIGSGLAAVPALASFRPQRLMSMRRSRRRSEWPPCLPSSIGPGTPFCSGRPGGRLSPGLSVAASR